MGNVHLLPMLAVLFMTTAAAAPVMRISGTVSDAAGNPISDAVVRFQATDVAARTDRDGAFRLSGEPLAEAKAVTAGKSGFLNGGVTLEAGKTEYRIVLSAVPDGDNSLYRWEPSRPGRDGNQPGDHPACEACHPDVFREWEGSAHAGSATNPLFRAVFNGTGADGRPTGGPGYRLDFPNSLGNCAACHIPVQALDKPFGADPGDAQGVAAEGISCDLCHKVDDAAVDNGGGRPGVLSLAFKRPPQGEQLFFGPLDDVIAGPDGFNPVYRESRYCAPCHNGAFWGVPAYSEFAEWAASSYAEREISCQDCHMGLKGGARRFAIEREGGRLRQPATISSHVLYGLNDESFMKGSVALTATAESVEGALRLRVSVRNVNGGHHIPTGSPMRNMILVVEAAQADGERLEQIGGEVIPLWGGGGPESEDNYAGLPGRGFAKILAGRVEYPADRTQGREFALAYPAPYWRPVTLAADTRIPADGTDRSEYLFRAPRNPGMVVTITTRLIYRRTFKSWGNLHRVKNEKDLELASSILTVRR